MRVWRAIGWLLLLATLTVAVRDGLGWADTQHFAPISLGGLWDEIGGAGLRLSWARAVAPIVRDGVMMPFLRLWAAPVLAVPGLALVILCR